MLTARQRQVLLYVNEKLRETGVCPTYREICEDIGIPAPSMAHRIVMRLEERGFVRRLHGKHRALEVLRLPADRHGGAMSEAELHRLALDLIRTAQVSATRDEEVYLRVDRDLWETLSREIEDGKHCN